MRRAMSKYWMNAACWIRSSPAILFWSILVPMRTSVTFTVIRSCKYWTRGGDVFVNQKGPMTTHRERIQACLAGEMPDQTPVALWRHFPVDDQSPETLVAAQIAFQRAYDFDLVKVTPASSFCLRDWGAEDEWRGDPEGTRQYTKHVIFQPQDWERLPVLDPTAPHLAGQLACLRQIRAGIGT